MKKAVTVFQTIFLLLLIGLFIVFSAKAKAQTISGMKMCINIIVPSLLPILILTNTAIKSEASTFFEFSLTPIAKLLKFPPSAMCAIIFGLIGGYPTGALLTEQLFEHGAIDKHTARRMLRFNFCGGVAFIITAVGTIKLNSTKIGVVIYTINLLSSLIICIAESLFEKPKSYKNTKITKQNFSTALVNSVENSTKSIAIMCGYITFFSALSGLFNIPKIIMPLIEITNGVFSAKQNISLPYLCFFLCFGGFCIHFQLFGIIKKVNMNYFDFFIHRLAGGIISYFLGKGYIVLFAPEQEVFSNISNITPIASEINSSLSLMLLASCVIIVVDLHNKKSSLI